MISFHKVLHKVYCECKHDRFIYRIVTLNDSGSKNVLSLELFILFCLDQVLKKLEFERKEIGELVSSETF